MHTVPYELQMVPAIWSSGIRGRNPCVGGIWEWSPSAGVSEPKAVEVGSGGAGGHAAGLFMSAQDLW